uniref:Uncharacterized protein n=1 Tax=Anguilla anguilla TaxID=7936 RepID=A0A0E9QFD5_ANGAN
MATGKYGDLAVHTRPGCAILL